MLVSLLKNPDVSFVHLVPTFQNPLKDVPSSLNPSVALKRRLMEAWISSLKVRNVAGFEKLKVEWCEVEAEKSSYTIDTLSRLMKDVGKDAEWVLCLGDDGLPDLNRWKDANRLLGLVKETWVFRRAHNAHRSFLNEVPTELTSLTRWRLLLTRITEVSSTKIREFLGLGEADARRDCLKGLVLAEILAVLGESPNHP